MVEMQNAECKMGEVVRTEQNFFEHVRDRSTVLRNSGWRGFEKLWNLKRGRPGSACQRSGVVSEGLEGARSSLWTTATRGERGDGVLKVL